MILTHEADFGAMVQRLGASAGVLVLLDERGGLRDTMVYAESEIDPAARRALFLEGEFGERSDEPVCRVCGCSQWDACEGGCGWALPDLCTRCHGEADESAERSERS